MNLASNDLTAGDQETAKLRLTSRRTFLKAAAATGAVAATYAAPQFSSFGPKPAYATTFDIPCLSFIDFDTIGGLSAGDVIGSNNSGAQPWSGSGVTVETLVRDQSAFHAHGAMIFNSAFFTGSDADLATPGGGDDNDTARFNVLIISEDGVSNPTNDHSDGPDDDAAGGVIVFQFGTPRKLSSVGLLDIDDNENGNDGSQTRISAYNTPAVLNTTTAEPAAGALIGEVNVPGKGNNSWQDVAFAHTGVRELRIRFRFSGAIGRIDFDCP